MDHSQLVANRVGGPTPLPWPNGMPSVRAKPITPHDRIDLAGARPNAVLSWLLAAFVQRDWHDRSNLSHFQLETVGQCLRSHVSPSDFWHKTAKLQEELKRSSWSSASNSRRRFPGFYFGVNIVIFFSSYYRSHDCGGLNCKHDCQ